MSLKPKSFSDFTILPNANGKFDWQILLPKVCDVTDCSHWADVTTGDTKEHASVGLCSYHLICSVRGEYLNLTMDYVKSLPKGVKE